MGNLAGHVLPGSLLIIFSVCMSISNLTTFFWAKARKRPLLFRLSSHDDYIHVVDKFKLKPPREVLIRLCLIVCDIIGEYLTALDSDWNLVQIHNEQHITILTFFVMYTLLELMYYLKVPGLPPGLDQLIGASAAAVTGLLFQWHLHGRTDIDIQVHTLFVYACYLGAISMCLTATCPTNFLCFFATNVSFAWMGLWFSSIGFILYPPSTWATWKPFDHNEMMIITMLFTWCGAAALMLQVLIGVYAYRWVQRDIVNGNVPLHDMDMVSPFVACLPQEKEKHLCA